MTIVEKCTALLARYRRASLMMGRLSGLRARSCGSPRERAGWTCARVWREKETTASGLETAL